MPAASAGKAGGTSGPGPVTVPGVAAAATAVGAMPANAVVPATEVVPGAALPGVADGGEAGGKAVGAGGAWLPAAGKGLPPALSSLLLVATFFFAGLDEASYIAAAKPRDGADVAAVSPFPALIEEDSGGGDGAGKLGGMLFMHRKLQSACQTTVRGRRKLRYHHDTRVFGAQMKVNRIVANVHTENIAAAERFYQDVLGLEKLMDHGWIATYGLTGKATIQISFASQGGSGTSTPDLSIEVDDLDAACRGMVDAGFPIEYGPADEPWGVRRFYVRDPFGKLINILSHA